MNVSTHSARALATPRTPATTLARLAGVTAAALALLCLPAAAEAQTLTIGNAATGEAASTVAPGSGEVLLDAFTLAASAGTANVTSLTVVLPVGSAAVIEQVTIESAASCTMPTPYGTALNPATDTVTITTTGLSVTAPTAAPLFVCLKPKAATAMPAVPGSAVAITGRVSAGVAAGFTVSSTDAVSPARTVDNASPGSVTAASGVAGDHQVGLKWTNPADADFKQVVILQNTSPISDVPVEGASYEPFTFNDVVGAYQPTLVGTSRVAYVGTATTVAIGSGTDASTWLTNGTPYYFKIFARDYSGNYSAVGATVGPITPVAFSATTIGPGTESAAANLGPGGPITNLDAFTLVTSAGTDTVTAATVSLSPPNAFANVGLVQITSNDGLTVYASATNPTSSSVAFTGLTIPVSTTPVQFRVRIQPKSHAAMPPVPGASYAVTGLLTSYTCTKTKAGSDTGSSTVTIDNLSPNSPTWGTVTPASGQVTLNWTNPTGDFLRVAIVRNGAPVTAVPVEGDLGATPALTGTGTVAFVGATTTTVVSGLTNGTPYYFKVFAQDTNGNWSVGTGIGPLIPGTGASSVGSTVPDTTLPVVQVVNPIAGSKVATTFKVQVRAWSPVADITGVAVRVNLGAPSALTKNTKYGSATTSGVWDGTLTLAAGTYTIDAQATSSVGTVTSNSLSVTVSATKGDGNLLVRDNAAQLCTDCHALPTHSSEATGSTYGSWSTSCRDCHTPHGTHNVFLVGESITPPPRGAGTTTPKTVAFSNTSGTPGNLTARTTATYVNTDNTGPCQVCHTLTLYYRADGSSPGGANHQSGNRCTNCHQHQSGMAVNCTGCHGTAGRTGAVAGTDPKLPAAPPRDTTGSTVTSSPGVGAHLAHLNQNNLRANPLACADCHPANNAHQGTIDFAWSALANGTLASVPLTPSFNGTTCASTWCHTAGGTIGGTILAPNWTAGSSQVVCGACHGAPPPAPHPANPNCNTCHPGYATTGLNAAAKVTHIDGVLQVPPPGACTSCHGTAGRTPVAGLAGTDPNIAVAPPMDTTGSTVVDAHMAHINKQSAPVQCLDCHGTLPSVGDPSHPNGTVDVTFAASALANQNGGFATYVAGTCNSVYCHGATLPAAAKGTNTAPTWTDVVTCGTCHGAPPGDAIHAAAGGVTTCYKCHNLTVNTSGGIIVNAGLHVNGTVESNVMDNGCESCHGTAGRANANGSASTFFAAAPPTATNGSTSSVGVGVHQAHVNGTRSKNVECKECHLGSTAFEPFSPNPASMWLHADGVVDLRFGPLASQGGVVPAYTLGSGSGCAATYCHGNFSGGLGATNVTPNWTAPGQLACNACHGMPPALPHTQTTACGSCHGTGYSYASPTTGTVQQVAHIDGTVTGQSFGCSSCHGVVTTASPGAVPADPLAAPGVGGGVAVTTTAAPSPTVPQYGAHAAHLTQSNFTGAAIACGECHLVPAAGNTSHGNGVGGTGGAAATITWSALATGTVAATAPTTQLSAKGGVVATARVVGKATAAAAAGPGGGATTDAWSTAAVPDYSRALGCSKVYCHGEFRNGQTGKTVVWAQDTVLTCNSCHGTPGANPATPPTGSHPASNNCGACHNGYTGTSVNVATHLNGKLEVSGGTSCSDCHGDATRLAMVAGTFGPSQSANNLLAVPPKDSTGGTSGVRVGPHPSHTVPAVPSAQIFKPVQCSECHGLAVNSYGLGHSNGVSDVTFASATSANLGGVLPVITQNTPPVADTCTTYCHGASLTAQQKGSVTTWSWNSTASATCGSCHGAAPNDPVHTTVSKSAPTTACNPCHNTVVNTSGGIIFTGTGTAASTLHINGSRQNTAACNSCHGGAVNAAPPVATAGSTAVTNPKVGAHQKHLTSATYRAGALTCADCHAVPALANHATGAVDITWNTLAVASAVSPTPATGALAAAWESTPTCTNYCHGGKWSADALHRGNNTSPSWTTTGMACDSCHRAPPASSGHSSVTSSTNCGNCHTGYNCTSANLAACTVNKTVHLNGSFEGPVLTCSSCHGTAGRTMQAGTFGPVQVNANNIIAVPPVDTQLASTGVRVGGHMSHTVPTPATQVITPVLCQECHGIAVNTYTTSHSNGVSDVTFASATRANLGGVTPGLVQNTPPVADTCTTYCHGASLTAQQKGSVTTWSWNTTVNATCGSCHGAAPADPVHTTVSKSAPTTACNPCHNTVVNTSGGIIFTGTGTAATTLHINGTRQNTASCNSCHGGAVNAAPPVATAGSTAVTNPKVGAHQKHVTSATYRTGALTCADCHAVPTLNNHATGSVNITWNTLAVASAVSPTPATGALAAAWESTPTCTNYCHGGQWVPASPATNAQYRGNKTAPSWTTTGMACDSCHLAPPTSVNHGTVLNSTTKNCGDCHTGYSCTTGNLAACTVNKSVHLNGSFDAPSLSCTSCHGTTGVSAAPPTATNGASSGVKVGAHQKHLTASNLRSGALACDNCHTVPASTNHANGAVNITWNTLATTLAVVPTPATGALAASWESTPTCTNYCHGGKWAADALHRGNTTTVSWLGTSADMQCDDCHRAPPTSSGHSSVTSSTNCGSCHTGYNCTSANLAACTVNKTVHLNGVADIPNLTCSSCHGTAGRTMQAGTFGPVQVNANNIIAVPPIDTQSASTGVRVGGHMSHTVPTPATQVITPVLCQECHGIAVNTYTTSHPNGVSDVTFASATRANLGGVTPGLVQNTPPVADTCTTYCHGASLTAQQKGSVTTWSWNTTVNATCGSCHGAAPNDPVHTTVSKSAPTTACNPCHNTVVNTSGGIIFTGTGTAATTLHINGSRQNTAACNSCHGGAVNAAPPVATAGSTATSNPKVGAHQKHVTSATYRVGALTCADCHAVPTLNNHASGSVNITWNTLAVASAVSPTPATGALAAAWESTPTCTNYCHGGKWSADAAHRGNNTTPSWITAGMACDSCHRAPPTSSGHSSVTSSTNCGSCHNGYNCTSANLAACTVNKTVHLNGVPDLPVLTCSSCHGTAGRTMQAGTFGPVQVNANNIIAVPPVDTQSASTGVRVGGHISHTVPTPATQVITPVLCQECHGIAVNTYTTSHPNGVSDVTFASATRANLGGVTPGLVQNTPPVADTCTTYCHGASLTAQQKGSTTVWSWNTTVNATCGSCHGASPSDPVHTSVSKSAPATACNPCHNTVVNTSGGIIFTGTGTAATTLHINGSRQNTAACNSCHGGAVNAAPPVATVGSTAVTNPKVGAHQKHVTSTTYRTGALTCSDCHTVPALTNHASGSVNITWNTLATTSAVVPTPATGALAASWESTPTCTNYCHGGQWVPASPATNAQYRGNNTAPSWTTTGMACDSCHRAPPTSSAHSSVTSSTNCSGCHTGYNCTSANLAACTVNKTTHINGQLDASSTCVDCHAAAIGTRRAVVPEFSNTWSHKRSASPSGTVTKYDCCVCHMEGDVATGNTNATYHQNGVINLRDPDTGQNIKGVSFTGGTTEAGAYTSTAVDVTFVSFVRNLSSNALEPAIQAMMINQCLKCHDADGAASTLARVPGGTQYKPFNTTIGSTSNYTGTGITAGGTPGGVTDVNASFATANAAYHPVRGKQNNSYVSSARMNAPWNGITKTGGNTTSWGYLISCWDCHSAQGASGVQTRSVTAHGSATTLRQQYWVVNNTNLCTSCHYVFAGNPGSNHGTGSAFATGGNSGPGGIAKTSCFRCHGSLDAAARPTRPYSAQDVHGVDGFAPSAGTGDTLWPVGSASNTYRPYAFFRNVGSSGMWKTTSWKPLSGPGVPTGAATCGGNASLGSGCSNNGHNTYTPGGVY